VEDHIEEIQFYVHQIHAMVLVVMIILLAVRLVYLNVAQMAVNSKDLVFPVLLIHAAMTLESVANRMVRVA
jgi:hypothetical protein